MPQKRLTILLLVAPNPSWREKADEGFAKMSRDLSRHSKATAESFEFSGDFGLQVLHFVRREVIGEEEEYRLYHTDA
jgi:hypothetical protein